MLERIGASSRKILQLDGNHSYFLNALTRSFDWENQTDIAQRLRQLDRLGAYEEILDILPSIVPYLVAESAHHYIFDLEVQLERDLARDGFSDFPQMRDIVSRLIDQREEIDDLVLPSPATLVNYLINLNCFDGRPTLSAHQNGSSELPFQVSLSHLSPMTWRELRHRALVQGGEVVRVFFHEDSQRILEADYDSINSKLFFEQEPSEAELKKIGFLGHAEFRPRKGVLLDELSTLFSRDILALDQIIEGAGSSEDPFTIDWAFQGEGLSEDGQILQSKKYVSVTLLYALFQSASAGSKKFAFNTGLLFEADASSGRFRYVGGAYANFDSYNLTTNDYVESILKSLDELVINPLREEAKRIR